MGTSVASVAAVQTFFTVSSGVLLTGLTLLSSLPLEVMKIKKEIFFS